MTDKHAVSGESRSVIQRWLQDAADKNIHLGNRALTDAEFELITQLLQVMAADEVSR